MTATPTFKSPTCFSSLSTNLSSVLLPSNHNPVPCLSTCVERRAINAHSTSSSLSYHHTSYHYTLLPTMPKEYFCDCLKRCKGRRKMVSRSTYIRHDAFRKSGRGADSEGLSCASLDGNSGPQPDGPTGEYYDQDVYVLVRLQWTQLSSAH